MSARRHAARKTWYGTTKIGSRSIRTMRRRGAAGAAIGGGGPSRAGETVLRAVVTDRVQPGVVYTTFHFPESGANVVTTENSDWATNCPEYKVTAVQVVKVTQPSEWQRRYHELTERQRKIVRERSVSHS